ncbi:MAG: hypothetical protein LBE75_04545 [Burkholderiales bacterium]|jgi:D-alanyl-lipoteichoic acid acyltransferase DltB (MBOAT superfamily)|nr:hypothetical protein [Burkholderiales bacterium]
MTWIKILFFIVIVSSGIAAMSFSVARARRVQILLVFLMSSLILFFFNVKGWMESREESASIAIIVALIVIAIFFFCSMVMLEILRERSRPQKQVAICGQMSALITVSRDSGYADYLRKYRVICDGVEIGQIANGKSAKFTISTGAHSLVIKIDWCGSNEVHFNIDTGQSLHFDCGSNLRGWRLFLASYYGLFARNKYLWLRRQAQLG